MNILYINGPVQNGPFAIAERPGKVAGIRAAEALNTLLGAGPVPHLWNTVTLAGDLRHRDAPDRDTVGRQEREERAIAAKYAPGAAPAGGVFTDTTPVVAALALEMTERLLLDGALAVVPTAVHLCARCGHMTGAVAHACRACGHQGSRPHTRRLLVWDRPPGTPVLARDDFHAHRARPPGHLLTIAQNVPERLILSRTRDHGISLAPLGLDGLVLDPRAGVHIAVLAAAARFNAGQPVMTVTENAAANVAAYGALFRRHNGTRLRYVLHGRIPYDDTAALQRLCEVHRVSPALRELFLTWFLPLCSLHIRAGITAAQLPGLLKFWRRAHLARPDTPGSDVFAELRRSVAAGDMRWVMDVRTLSRAIPEYPVTHGFAKEPEGAS
jgi:ribosomal protein L40E